MKRKAAVHSSKAFPKPIETPLKPARRPPQFPIGGLFGLMVVVGIAMAPAYYFIRGVQGDSGSRLAGMLIVLAGPLLLVILISSLLGVVQWWNRR